MNPQSNSPSLSLPVKRKRGRPRKDESPMQGENKAPTCGSVEVDDDMVGQVVTGVIEGSFDAGYLLNVKVGGTDSNLRGVVFLPGRFSPITAVNDVAPQAKMYERKEISIPVCNPPPSLYSDGSPPGDLKQSNKENVEFKNHASPLRSPIVLSEPKLSVSMTTVEPSGLFVGALDDNVQKNDGNICIDSSASNQIQVSELASQPISVVEDMNCDKVIVLNEVLPDYGVSTTVKESDMKLQVNEVSGSEQASEPNPISMVPDVETICKESQNQHLAMSSVEKNNEAADDGLQVLKLCSNQTPVISEAEFSIELRKDVIDNQDSPKKETVSQSVLELATENTPIGRPGGDDFMTECGLLSAVKTDQPICIVEQDVPVVPKVTTEEFYCPGLFESRPCVSSGAVSDMECDVKDTTEKSVRPEFAEPQLFISAGTGSEMECDVKDAIPPTQY